jgi:hypothetical protein
MTGLAETPEFHDADMIEAITIEQIAQAGPSHWHGGLYVIASWDEHLGFWKELMATNTYVGAVEVAFSHQDETGRECAIAKVPAGWKDHDTLTTMDYSRAYKRWVGQFIDP